MVEFCTEENHNKEAPTLQNQKCNLRSTWEVISDSEDFKKTTPMTTQPPAPSFSLLQIGQRIVCLVLDKSGSMSVCSIALVFWKLAKDMCAVWSGPQFVLGINTDPGHCHQNRPSSCAHQRVSTIWLICQISLQLWAKIWWVTWVWLCLCFTDKFWG